jgi:DNA-directed RNA polymerase specialized sigma24 family protein
VHQNLHTFSCTARRDGDRWIVECDQYPHVRACGRLLAHATRRQQHALAAAVGVPAANVTVDVQPLLPDVVRDHIVRAWKLRETAAWANREAAAARRAAVAALVGEGLSLRDIGTILGVSHQRAHQLLNHPAAVNGR